MTYQATIGMSTEAENIDAKSGKVPLVLLYRTIRALLMPQAYTKVPRSVYSTNIGDTYLPTESSWTSSNGNDFILAAAAIESRPPQGVAHSVHRLSELSKLQCPPSPPSELRRPCSSYTGRESRTCCGLCSHVFAQSSARRYLAFQMLSSPSLTRTCRPDSSSGRGNCNSILHLPPARCNAIFTHRPKNPPRPPAHFLQDNVYGVPPWTTCQYCRTSICRLA